jgi:hypothetical protein
MVGISGKPETIGVRGDENADNLRGIVRSSSIVFPYTFKLTSAPSMDLL